jgi:aspartyl protease family protein
MVHALFKDMVVISMDGKRYTLRTNKAGPKGIRLIRSDSYEATISVNGVVGKYTVGSHPVQVSYKSPKKQSIQILPDKRGMYNISGTINGNPVDFLVDTGANLVAMNQFDAQKIGVDIRKQGVPVNFESASGKGIGKLIKLDQVQIGNIMLRNVDAIVTRGSHPRKILLGMSFLKRVKMERNGVIMTLTQNH